MEVQIKWNFILCGIEGAKDKAMTPGSTGFWPKVGSLLDQHLVLLGDISDDGKFHFFPAELKISDNVQIAKTFRMRDVVDETRLIEAGKKQMQARS